jgi:hypothetical protein
MKEILETTLLELINTIKAVGDFTLEQLPLFVNELLLYYTISYSMGVLYGIVGIVLMVWYLKHFDYSYKKGNNKFVDFSGYESFSDITVMGILCGFIIIPNFIVSLFVLGSNINGLVKVIFAPRVFLIEKLTNFI